MAVICLGGAAFILSSLSQDLLGFGQPPARAQLASAEPSKAEDKLEPAEVTVAEILKEKDEQLRRLLEDSSEIDLRMPTFLQSEYWVEETAP